MTPEVWRDIPGYEGKYQASNLGQVRSLDRYVRCAHGAERLVRGRILKPSGNKRDPHLYVVLGHGAHGVAVHRLIAQTFIGTCPNGQEVRHLDGNPLNNKVDNLAYGTRSENILDVYRVGGAWRTLTVDDVRDIRARLAQGERGADIARLYGVSHGCISAIKCRRSYGWLT